MKAFKQHTSTKHLYHADLAGAEDCAHPIVGKPTWTVAHFRDEAPSHQLATLEVASDGMSARLTAHEWDGRVEVVVTAEVEPRTTVHGHFHVHIVKAPGGDLHPPALQFSQHRNGPI